MTCFKCGKETDEFPCSFDGKAHETKPHNIFEFKFAMTLNPAQEDAWNRRFAEINTLDKINDDPNFYEDVIIPNIKEMFFTFLKEGSIIYEADSKLLDEELEDMAGKN